jgi:hypothetical protein
VDFCRKSVWTWTSPDLAFRGQLKAGVSFRSLAHEVRQDFIDHRYSVPPVILQLVWLAVLAGLPFHGI